MVQFNFKHVQAFVTVADLGNFRRAAERLNTTQPNISNRISQLEHQLGDRLFDRDAGSVLLTRKGAALLPHARAILRAVDDMVQANGRADLFDGVLRLGVSELVAQTWLRPFLMQFKESFPAVDVELTVDLSANLTRALAERDLDLTFQSGPFDIAARRELPLGQSPYVWVMAAVQPDLPDPLTAQDMAAQPILTHARGTAPFLQLERHFRDAGCPARLVPSSNIAACLHLAMDGLGLACLPAAMVADPIAAGRLRRIEYGWTPEDLAFAARWNSDPTPPYIRTAADIAQGLFPPEG